MRFSAGLKELRAAVAFATRPGAAGSVETAALTLTLAQGLLQVSGWDLQSVAICSVAVAGPGEDGSASVGGGLLASTLAVLPGPEVAVWLGESQQLHVQSRGASYQLPQTPKVGAAVPPIPEAALEVRAEALASSLLALGGVDAQVVELKDGRKGGLQLAVAEDTQVATTICGARVLGESSSLGGGIVVPKAVLARIAKDLAQAGTIGIGCEGNWVGFRGGDGRMVCCRTSAATMRAYTPVLEVPPETPTFQLPVMEMVAALRQVLVVHRKGAGAAVQVASSAGGTLVLETGGDGVSARSELSGTWEFPATRYHGERLLQALSGGKYATAELAVSGTTSHVLACGDGFRYHGVVLHYC